MIDFKKCTEKAYEILLTQNYECGVPIKINSLDLQYPVIFESIQNYSKLTGYTVNDLTANKKAENGCVYQSHGYYIILHNELHCKERRNFTDGHEIGHIACGHKLDNKESEIEANFFSAQTIMPNALIKYLSESGFIINAKTLQEIFKVSPDAANRKMRTLKKYFQTHKWDNDIIAKYQDSLDRFIYT